MTWTPGPWRIYQSLGGWTTIDAEEGEVGRFDGLVPSAADARLIAAAPRMADVLAVFAEPFDPEEAWAVGEARRKIARDELTRVRGEA